MGIRTKNFAAMLAADAMEADLARVTAERDEAIDEAETHRRFCEAVHTEPLLDAVRTAALADEDTEGPTGCGGIDHAFTIRRLGDLVAALRIERDAAIARADRLERGITHGEAMLVRAERARDEVGIQYEAAQAEIARMKPVVEAARNIRHWHDTLRGEGMVVSSDAVRTLWVVLARLDTVPGDALAPVDTEDPTAGLLAASGVDVKGVG